MKRVILDNDTMHYAIDFSIGFPVLHLTLHKGITPRLYKYIKNVLLEDTMVTLGSFGFDTVFSILPEGDEKVIKFNKAMGFEYERTVDGNVWLAQDVL